MIQRFDSEITAVTGQTIDASSETSRMEFKLQYHNLRTFLKNWYYCYDAVEKR